MSSLVLVRHSQANMFGEDYDQLSATGEMQAERLGDFWIQRGVIFDEIYTGPRRRQRRTAELVGARYALAKLAWPEPVMIDELDEYDGDGMMKEFLPALAAQDERIRQLAEAAKEHNSGPERYRHFQRLFESLVKLWTQGALDSPRVESWQSFHDRVRRAFERITAGEPSGRRIAVFTSGGPISIAVQLAMRAPEQMAIELNWRIRNCSLTEIVFTKDRFTLDGFNSIPHLNDPALWTYR
jgi:broad specificity phosphatase PhoE